MTTLHQRFEHLDALRGVAMVWMAVFHFCFDLNYFGFIEQSFRSDPFWTVQRTCIVSLFIFCLGLGQAMAGPCAAGFWRRWGQVAGCAVLVSLGSAVMFPKSFISFGVLHCIAVLLLVLRMSHRAGRWLWLWGLVAWVLPQLLQHPVFDTRWSNWVGLVTRKPVAEDFAPVLPWLGVAWWGLASGQWLLAKKPLWLQATLAPLLRPLATLGRYSLSFYMLHQPILLGVFVAVVA
jgi:uncharacterized membrane protein